MTPIALGLLLALVPPSQKAKQLPPEGPTEPFAHLTNDLRDHTLFNVETVRGMSLSAAGQLYAINTHGSTLVLHTDAGPEPEGVWPTVNNPVSVAVFGDRVAVVGGGTHALAVHDATSGEILDVFPLPSEPGDLLVDAPDGAWVAYVASQGENCVVALDLSNGTELGRWEVPAERPRFLALDTDPQGLRRLLVAPMLSGNNTVPIPPAVGAGADPDAALGNILNLSSIGGLPDEDLFAITIDEPTPVVVPCARQAGSLLLEHARNPLTGEYWMLAIASHNDDVFQRSEAELRGVFASNTLAVYAPDALGTVCDPFCVTPERLIDLDDADPLQAGEQYDRSTSLAFPYGLAFVPEVNPFGLHGWACVTSSASDRIAFLDPAGNRVAHLDLPDGAIPRQVLIDGFSGLLLFVYCWGTNDVLVYNIADLAAPPLELPLGLDPTPEPVRRGRKIWYDAGPSLNGRTTCNHCHPNGGMDLLGWKLSDIPADRKDVMVTQSLFSILDTPAYHWREERFLPDFNVAFPGLLGHDEDLDEDELADFVAFVFALQGAANPSESEERVLDDRRTAEPFPNGLAGSAVRGQRIFLRQPTLGANTCFDCHMGPNGTQGRELFDAASSVTTAMNMGVAHLRQLRHKDQDVVEILGFRFARQGFGVLHDGLFPNPFEFIAAPFFSQDDQGDSDVTAFVQQFDQGLAPAAHRALLLDERDTAPVAETIARLFLRQARKGWIDVVAHGWVVLEGARVQLRWLYDPEDEVFVPHSTAYPELPLAALAELSAAGLASNVILGLPAGNGRRFALDPDDDGLLDEEELVHGTTALDPDSDDDGFPDGYEVAHGTNPLAPNATVPDADAPIALPGFPRLDHVTAGYAKFHLASDEPVTVEVEAQVSGGPVHRTVTSVFARRQTIVVQGLDPSLGIANLYTATIRMRDLSGNVGTTTLDFRTRTNVTLPGQVRVGDLVWVATTPQGAALDAQAEVQVVTELGAPFPPAVPGKVVVLQLLYRTAASDPWSIAANVQSPQLAAQFQLRSLDSAGTELIEPYLNLPGPFLLSPLTEGDGRAKVEFSFPGPLTPPPAGVEVRLNVLAILDPSPGYDPVDPVFESTSLPNWKMPSTSKELRGLQLAY
jgi:hypothetical protein